MSETLLRKTVKQWANQELFPYVAQLEDKNDLPDNIFPKLADLGLLGMLVSEEYGGSACDPVEALEPFLAVLEELSCVEPGTCLSYLAHALLFMNNVFINGSADQCRRYLPKCAKGQWIGGMAMTEPEAGSDALGMKTTAQRQKLADGREVFVLNGTKCYITNGPIGDVFLVYARTGPEKRDLSAFLVEKQFPGFSVGRKLLKMGMRTSPTGELIFNNCHVPLDNLVGGWNQALLGMMRNLDVERLGLATMSLGIARACQEHALRYAQERQQFSTPIISFHGISEKLANMYIGYQSAKAFVEKAACQMASKERLNQMAAAAKVYASEMATKVGLDAIQVLGGYGYSCEFPVEKLMRDAKLLEIGGGTSEILRTVIIKEFLRHHS